MKSRITPEFIESLRANLRHLRQASLHAARNGDFIRVGRLTSQAAQVNKSIMDAQIQVDLGL